MKTKKIISRPKKSTLFSVGAFLLLALGILIYNTASSFKDGEVSFWQWVVYLVLGPIAIGILAKVILGYKFLQIDKNGILVKYPLKFQVLAFGWNQLEAWQEILIETNKQQYKHLEMRFKPKNKISISLQENTNYEQVVNWLKTGFPQLKKPE